MKPIKTLTFFSITLFLFVSGCVERIDFAQVSDELIVIEGMITDDSGPYTIKVSEGQNLDLTVIEPKPIQGLSIELFDDLGNSELFTETEPGIYQTQGVIQGRVGGTYQVRIESPSGKVYESIPETLHPVGAVKEIRYEFEERISTEDEFLEEVQADVFNIYFDAQALESEDPSYTRWLYTGTYKVQANPELNFFWIQGGGIPRIRWPDPWPCSGHVFAWDDASSRPTIEQKEPCICCTCWISDYEEAPLLTDGELVVDGEFNNIKAAEIPITTATFYERFRVEVAQMSMTKNAYDFFNVIREQKLGADDLFQPIPSEIAGNVIGINNNDLIVGIFWATSISSNVIYINRDEVPYPLAPIETVITPCQEFYDNSTNIQPTYWND